MNINAFETAFGKTKEGTTERKMDIFIRKRKCTHTVQIADEFSENMNHRLLFGLLQPFYFTL